MIREDFSRLLANWLKRAVSSASSHAVPIIGLSAPQGAGKTTLMREVCGILGKEGLNTISVSIDDFYLTRPEQAALAVRYPSNPYLQQRGYPGTHDLDLGLRVLNALRKLPAGGGLKVPGYDRFAHGGLGDRLPESCWQTVTGPLSLIILEGWMLGFSPISDDLLKDKDMLMINQILARYEAWYSLLNGFVWLKPEDYHFVREWRIEAEYRSRSEGKSAMSPAGIEAFIERFLPAYATYYPALCSRPPTKPPHLRIVIGRDRAPRDISYGW